ncbi:Flagellar biosynthetic protein flhB [Cedecea neteri]|uniref:Flagellar biosynthetic protein FlhB n=1 Tax=Cedecea neteri TaxID=158822 RepID=A0A2X3J744_9ENTR|nr:Flagellar biosynthetic protein flhB [Cedecea neteri]
MLLVGLCIIWMGGASLGKMLGAMLSDGLHFDHKIINDPSLVVNQISHLIKLAVMALLPLISGLVIVAIAAPMLLGGVNFSSKAIQFNLGKLNPITGIKRMFSMQTAAELLKAMLKAVLVGLRGRLVFVAQLAGDDAPDE